MKSLIESNEQLALEGRWDLDYHLPPERIFRYPENAIQPVSELAEVSKQKRDPTVSPEEGFFYVDISSVDVSAGVISGASEVLGEDAPSRARMSIRAFDVLVSTVRPTRGAVAVVPAELHGQICSTGFVVLRCREGVNPFFLHFVLRLPSTAEQFRKFATGSSYPAILDSDVLKTLVPMVPRDDQDALAQFTIQALEERERIVDEADRKLRQNVERADLSLRGEADLPAVSSTAQGVQIASLEQQLKEMLAQEVE